MTWVSKFDYVKSRSLDEVLGFWSRRSPVGIEIGQNRLAEHIGYLAQDHSLPTDGVSYIGPIESRTLISELYCGVSKSFNLNFHAQALVKKKAFTNGSLHSFNSLMQFMLAIISIFGIFVIRIGGKYFVLDVFPWLGHRKEDRKLEKQFGADWWRYARIIADRKETIEQREIAALFQRCLRMTTVAGWREVIINQLLSCEDRWFNRPRNNILYNFTGWSGLPDLMIDHDGNIDGLLKSAAESIFDPDAQIAYGSLPQSLLLGSLLTHIWANFREAVEMELDGKVAPEFPAVGESSLLAVFERTIAELLTRANSP